VGKLSDITALIRINVAAATSTAYNLASGFLENTSPQKITLSEILRFRTDLLEKKQNLR